MVDEALITKEFMPVTKTVGEFMYLFVCVYLSLCLCLFLC